MYFSFPATLSLSMCYFVPFPLSPNLILSICLCLYFTVPVPVLPSLFCHSVPVTFPCPHSSGYVPVPFPHFLSLCPPVPLFLLLCPLSHSLSPCHCFCMFLSHSLRPCSCRSFPVPLFLSVFLSLTMSLCHCPSTIHCCPSRPLHECVEDTIMWCV